MLFMNVYDIDLGADSPNTFNVVVDISMNSDPVKYEVDPQSGVCIVDRFLPVSMQYPCNYGFIPNTKAEDGDCLDVLLITRYPVLPGSMMLSRPIGMLKMSDEKGVDHKIIAVPDNKVDMFYKNLISIFDKSLDTFRDSVLHFFTHYKDLEDGKSVMVDGFVDRDVALKCIKDSL